MSARDLAATVRGTLYLVTDGSGARGEALEALAALVKQADDAQAALDTWIDRYDGARAEADGWHASSDATLARALRAEEALRQIAETVERHAMVSAAREQPSQQVSDLIADIRALAAAGADTEAPT